MIGARQSLLRLEPRRSHSAIWDGISVVLDEVDHRARHHIGQLVRGGKISRASHWDIQRVLVERAVEALFDGVDMDVTRDQQVRGARSSLL